MLITKRKFFNRKNRKEIYHNYKLTLNHAFNISEDYITKLRQLRDLKDTHRMNTHIYEMLCKVERDVTSDYVDEAILRCQSLNKNNYIVDSGIYEQIMYDMTYLRLTIGRMSGIITMIKYLEDNELGIRSV